MDQTQPTIESLRQQAASADAAFESAFLCFLNADDPQHRERFLEELDVLQGWVAELLAAWAQASPVVYQRHRADAQHAMWRGVAALDTLRGLIHEQLFGLDLGLPITAAAARHNRRKMPDVFAFESTGAKE